MALGTGVPLFGANDGRVGRAAVRGALAGFVVVFSVATAIGLNSGFNLAGSVGLGLFAGFWGGPGFGGMLGATLHIIWAQDLETAVIRSSSSASPERVPGAHGRARAGAATDSRPETAERQVA